MNKIQICFGTDIDNNRYLKISLRCWISIKRCVLAYTCSSAILRLHPAGLARWIENPNVPNKFYSTWQLDMIFHHYKYRKQFLIGYNKPVRDLVHVRNNWHTPHDHRILLFLWLYREFKQWRLENGKLPIRPVGVCSLNLPSKLDLCNTSSSISYFSIHSFI